MVTASTSDGSKSALFHRIRLLEALKGKYGKELVVFLDQEAYFYTRVLGNILVVRETETVGDSTVACVRGDYLEV